MADKVPHLVPGFDFKKLKLDPMDGFVMSRIDGKLGPRELARETGLPDFSVARALEKLEKLGAVMLAEPGAAPPRPPPSAPPQSAAPSSISQFDSPLIASKYDPKELEEPADLTPEQKKRVLDFYYRLDDADHYTLLGVTRDADKKRIKRAYFELAAHFHPDRFFKKQLGSFKQKMEVLFTRITEANDTLVDAAARAEYDAYLAEVDTTRGMETMLERAVADAARASAEAERAAQAIQTVAPAEPPPSFKPHVASSTPPSGPSPEEIQRRKEALARRLVGGGARPTRPSAAPPPESRPNPHQYASAQDAVDALKRRYEERLASATTAQADRYRASAEDALAKGDLVAASTAFQLATKFAPDDEALAARAVEIKQQAEVTLCDSYQKQALYEEKQGHWLEAGRSWQKVAKIRHDPVAHERAANALFRADGDLHEAAEHAKSAITLAPNVIENHITLVEIYLKAGLSASARRAAEAASALDANDKKVQALLKKLPAR